MSDIFRVLVVVFGGLAGYATINLIAHAIFKNYHVLVVKLFEEHKITPSSGAVIILYFIATAWFVIYWTAVIYTVYILWEVL